MRMKTLEWESSSSRESEERVQVVVVVVVGSTRKKIAVVGSLSNSCPLLVEERSEVSEISVTSLLVLIATQCLWDGEGTGVSSSERRASVESSVPRRVYVGRLPLCVVRV